jgi:REP element-mobilizing transposase RayT
MNFNPDIHHRRSIRLKGFDYARPGAYFVTICTRDRELLFENPAYKTIIQDEWHRTEVVRPHIHLDEFICMPNHIHGIISIVEPVGARRRLALPTTETNRATHRVAPTKKIQSNSLGAIIGQFKSITTKLINRLRGTIELSIWQRSYYEHIIRNEDELNRVRQYIRDNPVNWETDEENPNRKANP